MQRHKPAEFVTILEVTQRQDVLRQWNYSWCMSEPLELITPFSRYQPYEESFTTYVTTPVRKIVIDGQEHLVAMQPELERIITLALEQEAYNTVHKKLVDELADKESARKKLVWELIDQRAKLYEFNEQPWWKRLWQAWKGIK